MCSAIVVEEEEDSEQEAHVFDGRGGSCFFLPVLPPAAPKGTGKRAAAG